MEIEEILKEFHEKFEEKKVGGIFPITGNNVVATTNDIEDWLRPKLKSLLTSDRLSLVEWAEGKIEENAKDYEITLNERILVNNAFADIISRLKVRV